MSLNDRLFYEELYSEHLEEASFQYETRLAWLSDEEISWMDLDDMDFAMEPHIDALVIGAKRAMDVCLEMAAEADFSTLHVIVRVLCRHKLMKPFSDLLKEIDCEDPEIARAISDALLWESPDDWLPQWDRVLQSAKTEYYPLVASTVGYRAPAKCGLLIGTLEKANPDFLKMMIESASLGGDALKESGIPVFSQFLTHDDPDVAQQAAIGLLKIGEQRALIRCREQVEKFPIPMALGGSESDSIRLIDEAKKGTADENLILALGLTGNLSAVSILLSYLKHPDYGLQAAQALYLITGAPLFENVHVPEEVDEDELFEHELEDYRKGELPKNIDGLPFGSEVQRLSIDPEVWHAWIGSNKAKFQVGMRYRLGKLYSPRALLDNLVSPQFQFDLRVLVYLELVVRYNIALPFVADDLVRNQKRQLNDIHQWAGSVSLPEGRWYFKGRDA